MKRLWLILTFFVMTLPAGAQTPPELADLGAAPEAADSTYLWDSSAGALKEMTIANLADYIDGATMTFTNKSMAYTQLTGMSANIVSLLGAADYAAAAELLGLGVTDSPTFTGLTLTSADVGTVDVATFEIDSVEVTSSAAELNILDGATLTVTELNYVDGVTSALQTQLDGKAAIAHLSGNDPDLSTEGHLGWDANGDVLRGYDGTNQVAVGRKIEDIQAVVITPNDLADSERDGLFIWVNKSGMSFVVTGWDAWSDTDDTDLNIEEVDNDGANNATVDAVSIATNGTGGFYGSDTTITAATVENGHRIVLDFDDTDTPGQVHIVIYGYFNADVN
jgi:hypothetical protein